MKCPRGRLKTRTEVIDCQPCDESWICSEWGTCSNGQQTRRCSDEHYCGTLRTKPSERRNCVVPSYHADSPSGYQPPPPARPVIQEPSFFQKYKIPIAVGLGILLLLGLLWFLFYFYKKHHKKTAYNFNELKEWVKKERAMGTSNEDITQILNERTGWSKKEITNAFASLNPANKNNLNSNNLQNKQ